MIVQPTTRDVMRFAPPFGAPLLGLPWVGAGGPQPWTPDSIAGCMLAIDPDASKVTLDGSAVESVATLAARAVNLTKYDNGTRPVWSATSLGGKPGITYNNSCLTADAIAADVAGEDHPFTVVMRQRSTNLFGGNWAVFGASSDGAYHRMSPHFGDRMWSMRRGSEVYTDQIITTNANQTLTWIFSGTTVTIRRNGVANVTAAAQNVASCAFDRFTIGAMRTSSGPVVFSQNTVIGRILVYDSALSGGDLTAAEDWVTDA